jgi:hypothetical protein
MQTRQKKKALEKNSSLSKSKEDSIAKSTENLLEKSPKKKITERSVIEPKKANKTPKKRSSTSTKSKPASYTTSFNKEQMATYVLWRRPFMTLYYFTFELIELIYYYLLKLFTYKKSVLSLALLSGLITLGFNIEGAHLSTLLYMRKQILWCLYWLGLGVASSIGLGTGLHTFLLYLGPFIAQVTLAAYECNSLAFPEPPYPDKIVCPLNSTTTTTTSFAVSIFSIMSKVRLESFMWGAGTAIGELPPYFMARASALSSKSDHIGSEDDNDELLEFENLLEAEKKGLESVNFLDRMRLAVFKVIKKVGFWGILLCASIPNPLFDLAGITCGHFLVKFSTFFGATLIGKAVIKMHIQKMFVIFLFSQHHLDNIFEVIAKIPYIGENIQPLFQEWLTKEKKKLHKAGAEQVAEASESILSWLLNKIVLMMVLFFVVSIVNSLAQRRYKRLSSHAAIIGNKVAND